MKRTTKKVLLTAAVFSCMLNMNGCAYGPPPGEEANYQTEEQPAQVVLEVEDDETDTAEN